MSNFFIFNSFFAKILIILFKVILIFGQPKLIKIVESLLTPSFTKVKFKL